MTKSLSVARKFMVAIALPLFATLITLLLVFFSIQAMNNNLAPLIETVLPTSQSLSEMAYRASRVNSSINELILELTRGGDADDSTGELDEIAESAEPLTDELNNYRILLERHGLTNDEAFTRVEALGNDIVAVAFSITSQDNLDVDEMIELREELEDLERDFVTQIEALILAENAQLDSIGNVLSDSENRVLNTLFILAVLSAVTAFISARYLSTTIIKPLAELKQTALHLKEGDLKFRSNLKTGDELGQFALTFNLMAESIQGRIHEMEVARQRAEHSEQVKSAFLASMSHELRTPLNAVINYTKFVANGTLGEVNGEQKEVLDASADSAEHLLNLINDVLDMSKIESGSLTLFVEDNINLDKILTAAHSTAKSLAANKALDIDLQVVGKVSQLKGDRQRILQILLNILSNAVKFTPAEGKIEIRAEQQGEEVIIAVKDAGPGIPPEHHADVFLPFKQTASGLRQGGGTGLGMPISKSLAEAHGGRIELESAVGHGSTFTVRLPLCGALTPTLKAG